MAIVQVTCTAELCSASGAVIGNIRNHLDCWKSLNLVFGGKCFVVLLSGINLHKAANLAFKRPVSVFSNRDEQSFLMLQVYGSFPKEIANIRYVYSIYHSP